MARQGLQVEITEVNGDRYASLEMAQAAALGDVAAAVVRAVRRGLARGTLVVEDGRVRLAKGDGDDGHA